MTWLWSSKLWMSIMDRLVFIASLNRDGWLKTIYKYCVANGKKPSMALLLIQICSMQSHIMELIMADLSEKYELSILKDKEGRLIKFF